MQYECIETQSVDSLNEEVAKMISLGWFPQGGASVSVSESDEHYYSYYVQAMIKPENKE